ncbi:hypothetical protein F5Y04DRAFT_275443 [Hypomontagnella monticulosa]|nr:hypothetical protein F5Y04DRAFT_275443 [Hypomontagnella monticulosa]
MRATKLSIAIAWAALATVGTSARIGKRTGGYDALCSNVIIPDNEGPHDLTGDCVNNRQDYSVNTLLDLSFCYSVDDGQLVPRPGTSRIGECNACRTGTELSDYTILYCSCPKDDGTFIDTKVNLDDLIENIDGYLACFGQRAEYRSQRPYGGGCGGRTGSPSLDSE